MEALKSFALARCQPAYTPTVDYADAGSIRVERMRNWSAVGILSGVKSKGWHKRRPANCSIFAGVEAIGTKRVSDERLAIEIEPCAVRGLRGLRGLRGRYVDASGLVATAESA